MNVLLLAAGLGTRLRPVTNSIPKCLVPIMGKPLLSYWIELLGKSKQIDKILINTHYLPKLVEKFVRSLNVPFEIELIHEEKLLGTGGTLISQFERYPNQELLVAHADNLTLFDFDDFLDSHQTRPPECIGTMMTFVTDDPASCGIVELDSRGVVRAFHEKAINPPGNLANAAIFLFSPAALSIIKNVAKNEVIEISTDLIPHLLGRLFSYRNLIYHRDIGTPGALDAAQKEFKLIYEIFYETQGR